LIRWHDSDGLSDMIRDELTNLGREVILADVDAPLPHEVGVLFSFGPLGPLWPILQKLDWIAPAVRPVLVHWNTEGLPSPWVPLPLLYRIGAARFSVERYIRNGGTLATVLSPLTRRLLRFRYFGEYCYAVDCGLLDVLADSSALHVKLYMRQGLSTLFAPWGVSRSCYADLDLDRDIDVLWMGKRGTRRRSRLLDRVRRELRRYGVEMYMCDNEEHPFVFGDERTRILNRAKVTLNLARTWHDDNFSRFTFAMPNRSLVISEPLLPHCPAYIPGRHYVSVPVDALASTIHFYLNDDAARSRIVEAAHRLVFEHPFAKSIEAVLQAADEAWLRREANR
jgi:hypothetical protein